MMSLANLKAESKTEKLAQLKTAQHRRACVKTCRAAYFFIILFELKLTCTFQPFFPYTFSGVVLIVAVQQAIGKNLNLIPIHYRLECKRD